MVCAASENCHLTYRLLAKDKAKMGKSMQEQLLFIYLHTFRYLCTHLGIHRYFYVYVNGIMISFNFYCYIFEYSYILIYIFLNFNTYTFDNCIMCMYVYAWMEICKIFAFVLKVSAPELDLDYLHITANSEDTCKA